MTQQRTYARPFFFHSAVFLTVCLLFSPCGAQKASSGAVSHTWIRGTVRDAVTHRVLVRIVLMVESTNSGYAGQAETDTSGKFDLEGLSPSQYSVSIQIPGYYESVQTVDLSTNPTAYLTFELQPKLGTTPPAVAPEGPEASLDARLASVPGKARKEFLKARELWQKGDSQACMDHVNKAIKSYDRFADAYVLLGSAYIQQNEGTEAKSALDRAIEIDPRMADARFTLGTLQNRQKDYASAEKTLTEGLKLNDASAEGHYELAKTYWALGRWQEAEPHAQKAVTLMPTMAPAHVLLGNIALRKRDNQTARIEFGQYLRLDPQGPMSAPVREMIGKIERESKQAEAQKK